MSGWDDIKAHGSGAVSYRLMIEGWPHEWVTDRRITHATNADGRTVLPGLKYAGLAIGERIIMQEAKCDADGITFKLVPTDRAETTLYSLSFYPQPIAQLGTGLTSGENGLISLDGGAIPFGTVFHIGTEAIRKIDGTSCTRHVWDTQPQAHNITSANGTRLPVYIYDYPPAMEGRRAYLYVYGRGDDLAGDGTCIWRGIVATPPTLDRDGVTWLIDCHPITKVLAQQVAGYIQEAHPIGISHHQDCAIYVAIMNWDAPSFYENAAGFWAVDEANLIDGINIYLEGARAGAGLSTVDYIRIENTKQAGWRLHLHTNATCPYLEVRFGSLLLGQVSSGQAHEWQHDVTVSADGAKQSRGVDGNEHTQLQANTDYYLYLVNDNDAYVRYPQHFSYTATPAMPLGRMSYTARNTLWFTTETKNLNQSLDPDPMYWFPNYRIFVDQDLDGVEAVYISGTYWPAGIFSVLGTGSFTPGDGNVYHYIDVALPQSDVTPSEQPITAEHQYETSSSIGFFGVLDKSTTITVLRKYGSGTLPAFVRKLIDVGINANDGDSPFVTEADFASWDDNLFPTDPIQHARKYWFAKPKSLEDILSAELLFQNAFMRLEADGRIGVQMLPTFTDAALVDAAHTIDASTILTPEGGRGAWPGWRPQRDGLITAVEIKQNYDPIEDSWKGRSAVYQDPFAIAIHKTRGKVAATIAPYSDATYSVGYNVQETYARVALSFLAAFAREYSVITLKVPFKHFDILCGDIVSITHRLIPDGSGGRGMVARRGICIERRWNLDPANPEQGEISIYIPRDPVMGYAPSALITAKTNVTANTWNITASAADTSNIEWSSNGDGKVLEHFAVGDKIKVAKLDVTTEFVITGVVVSVNVAAGTAQIDLDSAWTPGSNSWVLEYRRDDLTGTNSTAHQRAFAYVADVNFLVAVNEGARRFS